ncbi:Pre-rRNA-processing protein IPI3 [Mycena sanguinolenta]|uniref:Pre-rRNA-processing protein IPI3 n=1 Tax=Mycena sanguinolenta TaxID=230812 RepID=A0A8H6Z1G6_9AGAR|nr:Pre-rRNA-processing protein IPI3 [Mycena sanguinolenta]
MLLRETILCAATPSTGPGAIAIHDLQTGSTLASFKQTNAALHGTAVVQSQDGQGGFLLAVQHDKSIMNVYNFQKDQISLKIVLPEKLSCIALDHSGAYCAGGTSQGRIYLWEVASGILFNSWDAHYRQVTVLKFTHDGAALLSGSEDSGVSVWSVSRLLDDDISSDLPLPYCVFSDHTLPVTDIACGIGAFPDCRVLSSSVDHSVKLWDISSQTLLTTFQFPQPISCLAWDLTERMFFAASKDGSIHQMNLFRQREDKSSAFSMEAIGGAGVTDIIHAGGDQTKAQKRRLISVGEPVVTITISLTSTLLLAGTSTGIIHIYDIPSHQHLRSISTHKGFSITHLATMLKPPDLIGHVSLSINAGHSSESIPVRHVAPFQRMRDAKSREAHDIAMMLPVQDNVVYEGEGSVYTAEALLRDHDFFVHPAASAGQDAVSLQSKMNELETEVARLREQLGKAKGVNDMMWETVVQKVVGHGKDESDKQDVGTEDERRRKRGRTDS